MAKFYRSKAWLQYRLEVQKKTIKEMADEAGCTQETINYYLNLYRLRNTRKNG